MMGTSFIEVEIAARLLEAGHRSEAYGVAIAVLHKVGDQWSDESRLCWDRAREIALAAQNYALAA
jgi:hypothetical protein